MSRLDDLVAHAGNAGAAKPLGDDAALGLCVVAPLDPSLTAWLAGDLGLSRGDAVVVRLPAAALPDPTGSGLDPAVGRSVAAACYLHGCSEVLLLGIEGGAATRNTATAIDALRKAEVDRSTVDGADLRSFLGLQGDVRQGLVQAAATLRATPYLPSRLAVHAALVDPVSGALTVLDSGYDKLRAVAEEAADGRGPVAIADPSLPPMPDRWTPDGAVTGGADSAGDDGAPSVSGIDPRLALKMAAPKPVAPSPAPRRRAAPQRPRRPRATTATRPAAGGAVRRPAPATQNMAPAPIDAAAVLEARPAADVAVDLATGEIRFAGDRRNLPPELLKAIQAVAYFLHDVYDDDERAMIVGDVGKVADEGGPAMVDALLQPLLHLGEERYKVLNEMLVLKEQLIELPDPVVREILTQMLR